MDISLYLQEMCMMLFVNSVNGYKHTYNINKIFLETCGTMTVIVCNHKLFMHYSNFMNYSSAKENAYNSYFVRELVR